MNTYIIPRSICLVILNGFLKFNMDILVRPIKLYKMSSKATLIPLVMESSEGGRKWNYELVPISRFKTLTNNVALLTRVWRRSKCFHIWMRRNKWNESKHIEKLIPLTCGFRCLPAEDYLSQSISCRSSKNSFLGKIGSPLARASHWHGKVTQLHSLTHSQLLEGLKCESK
jgi:hypothetical protein